MILVWVKFLVCALIVVFAATKLSRYGDIIAEKTGLSHAWVGLLLLATVTSMPELITAVSAVAVVGVPDLAIGAVLGSNLFNFLIIAFLDVLHRHTPLLAAVSRRQILSASLYMLIIVIAGLGIFVSNEIADPSIGWFGLFSLGLLLSYLVSLRVIFRFEHGSHLAIAEGEQELKYTGVSLGRTYLNFALGALVIIGAGVWLASIGDEISEVTGWGASFVGTLFLPIINSLPEMAVCISALRLGAIDMAVANILGSNMFNIGIIIAASDLFYREGSVLSAASVSHALTALIVVLMTVIVLVGIRFPSKRKMFRVVSWESLILIALYVTGVYLIFVF